MKHLTECGAAVVLGVAAATFVACSETSDYYEEGSRKAPLHNQVFGGEFDEELAAIYKARESGDVQFLEEKWRLASAEFGDGSRSPSSNQLQLVVLVAEALYMVSSDHKVETESFLIRLADSRDPSRRAMAALSLDSVNGDLANSTLIALLIDEDPDVSRFAAQSIKSKLSGTKFSGVSKAAVEDAKMIRQKLGEVCLRRTLSSELVPLCNLSTQPK